jgi:hypothetical protein
MEAFHEAGLPPHGRYAKMRRQLTRIDLLILVDWGLETLNPEQRRDLLEIVEDRYDTRSLIMTSQVPSTPGTTSSATPPSPTPFSTASSTPPTASTSSIACANPARPAAPLDPTENQTLSSIQTRRNHAQGGRHQIGIPAGFASE